MKIIGLYQDYNGCLSEGSSEKNKVCAVIPAALIEFSLWGKIQRTQVLHTATYFIFFQMIPVGMVFRQGGFGWWRYFVVWR